MRRDPTHECLEEDKSIPPITTGQSQSTRVRSLPECFTMSEENYTYKFFLLFSYTNIVPPYVLFAQTISNTPLSGT